MVAGGRLAVISMLALLPTIASADYVAESIGQGQAASSMLIQPPIAFLTHEPAPLMFQGPFDASHLGVSMSYNDPGETPAYLRERGGLAQDPIVSATAVGEFALTDRVDLFGKYGIRYLNGNDLPTTTFLDNVSHTNQLDRRFGFGVKVKASEVLSLHFEWERFAQGNSDATLDAVSNGKWDPWKERNVFGAGLRLGF